MFSQFGSLGYTIMGKGADLTVVQKTIIDTLHKEGKTQTFIPKEAGCSQSAVSKHVNRKLSGRKKCGRKRCTTNRENRSLMRIVKQNRFKNLSELHKDWTEAGVKASRATTHRRVKEFGYSCHIPLVKPLLRCLTWTKEKKNWTVAQWSKVLFSDESKFCISFGNQGPRVWRKGGEAQSPSSLKSSVKFLQSVMIWGAMSSAGVGPLCFLKTKVTAPVYQDILEHFMLPSADQLFENADFIFQQDLAPAHTAKSTKSWLNDHGVGQKEPLPSIEYMYSKLTYFPEGQQFTKNDFFYWSLSIYSDLLIYIRTYKYIFRFTSIYSDL
uniref:Transposase Tc1-like domain-containing protein n=1 Tax=Cyprinus carpio carpio TaxID=630221 RepID=A0A8C0XXZ4_CYPCA